MLTNLNHRVKKPASSTFTYTNSQSSALNSPCSSISNGGQQLDYAASISSIGTSKIIDNAESECLEHYESNLEKYKDERDTIQKKTFTKWVNKHLTKSGRTVENLFRDLQNGLNLIFLLEALSDESLPRENGLTRFHSIQNVHYCLDFLRKKHIKLVNIRPEDIVDGNGKLTLGLIWTIILNFQVSVINQRRLQQQQREQNLEHISCRTTTEEMVSVTNGNGQTIPLASSYSSLTKISESHHIAGDGISARDALLQWARRVTEGYQGVHVTNFTNSWKDGLAFNAILHHYRPSAVNWNKISDTSVNVRERLQHSFDAFEKEFNIVKLLDPEDVDVDNPDEKSVLTYVSSLYNTLAHDEFSKGNSEDLLNRLTRGIGITNEKLDHILLRIENVETRIGSVAAIEVERAVRIIVEDLDVLETPISDYFQDVETLKVNRHPEAQDLHRQVFGLHQRRGAYLDRLTNQILVRVGIRVKEVSDRYEMTRTNAFQRVEESVRWVRERTEKLNVMQFSETLETLEDMFEHHKLDNRDIQDYRQIIDQCIARQAEVSAEDSYEYCELLQTLESEYQQLRDLSAGRMLDLDSLIAFIRAAQLELVWIHEREEIEVTRNWSDINQLDLPMLQNYFRQLLHEIEIHEKQFNDVHNQGAALINQRHPAGEVIEVYLRAMQSQWDWLLNLSRCLENHLRDGLNLKSFMEEAEQVDQWMTKQIEHLETNYNRSDFTLEEGERWLRELDEIREVIQKYHGMLMSLSDRCAQISPLWQRGERISRPIVVTAMCDYKNKEITIRAGDDCTLLDNYDPIHWKIRGMDGVESNVPSVVFRIPPPDPRLATYLSRLHAQFEKLRKMWEKKHRLVRYNMVLNTMKTVRGWDIDTFLSIPPEQRDEIIKALNEDANKLMSEIDPNDPMAHRLKDELRATNEHFYDLLNKAQKGPEPDYSNQFDEKMAELLKKLEEAWKKLNNRVGENVPQNLDDLERLIHEHKNFEDALQALDVDVSNVKELFRQLPNPTPTQRANLEHMNGRWEDLWDLSRMYVERLKALEAVLQGLEEVTDIVRRHEITLSSFDDLPAALDKLRGVHSQLIELNMVLQQQQEYVQTLNKNVAQLRQHVARTRFNVSSHPDVDRLEEAVQNRTVRWDNVCSQVAERLKTAEETQQTQMIYRSQYDEEILWLDRVEATINSLRRPEDLRPEELQSQLDQLVAEYAQLQEHTATIENINKEGGKFIRDAKSYDIRLNQFHDNVLAAHGPGIRSEFRRQIPQSKNGAQIVTEELEALNRRFAQLSSVILERKNIVNVLIQNWRRKQQDSFYNECLTRSSQITGLLSELSTVQRSQQDFPFDFGSVDATANARLEFIKIRSQLANYHDKIKENVHEADLLCQEGAEILSPDQFHALKENQQRLKNTYEGLIRQTDGVLDRLDIATVLLIEFSTRSSRLQSWILDKTKEIDGQRLKASVEDLVEAKKELKLLEDEIHSMAGELKQISQLGVRIDVEICKYIDELRKKEVASHPQMHRHQINETLERVQDDYAALARTKNDYSQYLNRLKSLISQHEENHSSVNRWLSELERNITHTDLNPVDTEVRLSQLLQLKQSTVENQHKLEKFKQSARQLVDATSGTEKHEQVQAEQQQQLDKVHKRYETLSNRIEESVNSARAEITEKEGLKQGLESMNQWLDSAESKMLSVQPLPLNLTELNDLKYEDQLKRSELASKFKTLKDLSELLRRMRLTSPTLNHQEEKGIEDAFNGTQQRFNKLNTTVDGLSQNLLELITSLDQFHQKQADIRAVLTSLAEEINNLESHDQVDVEVKLTRMVNEEWPALEKLAKRILSMPNLSNPSTIHQQMKSTSQAVQRLQSNLATKLEAGLKVSQNKQAFDDKYKEVDKQLVEQVEAFLKQEMSSALDLVELQQQLEQCNRLKAELTLTRTGINELEELGSRYVVQTGQSTRRSMHEGSVVDQAGLSHITQQLFALRKRQEDAERLLQDLIQKIAQQDDRLRGWNTQREALNIWLSSEHNQLMHLQKGSIQKLVGLQPFDPQNKNVLSVLYKEVAGYVIRRKEKQPEMDALRLKTQQLISSLEENDQATENNFVSSQYNQLNKQWNRLEESTDQLKKCSQLVTTLLDECSSLDKWMIGKTKMLKDACGLSADINMLNNMLILLQMLENEYKDGEVKWIYLNDTAGEVVRLSENDAFCQQVVQITDNLNKRWKELGTSVTQRKADLLTLKELAIHFYGLQKDIKQDLLNIEEKINNCTWESSTQELRSNQLSKLQEAEKKIEQLKPSFEIFEDKGQQIQDILVESSMQLEVAEKVDASKQHLAGLLRKIDSIKQSATTACMEEEEASRELNSLIKWIKQKRTDLHNFSFIPTDLLKMDEHFTKDFNQLCLEILTKENEIFVTSGKVAEVLKKSSNTELKQKLLGLNQQWPILLSDLKERQQMVEKTKKILVQLNGLENTVKEQLVAAREEIEKLSKNTDKIELQPAQDKLVEVQSNLEACFGLVDKLENLNEMTEKCQLDTKKLKLNLEAMRRQHNNMMEDCNSMNENFKSKNESRNKFESEVESLQQLLDITRNTFKLDKAGDEQGNGKEALKQGLAELESKWQRGVQELQLTAGKLLQVVDSSEVEEVKEATKELKANFNELKDMFNKSVELAEHKETALESIVNKSRRLSADFTDVLEKISGLSSISRDLPELQAQKEECAELSSQLANYSQAIAFLAEEWKSLQEHGIASVSQSSSAQKDLDKIARQVDKSRTEIGQRTRAISSTFDCIEALERDVAAILEEMDEVSKSECLLVQPVPSSQLRQQQEAIQILKAHQLKHINDKAEEILVKCKELIRSASPQKSTSHIEDTVTKVGNTWRQLSGLVEEKERQLDGAIQGLGNYGQAYNSLINWLEETEELVNNQKPPSADHKVVRAQLQNHDFQLKLVDDKQPSVEGFLTMIDRMEKSLPGNAAEEKKQMKAKADEVSSRYNELVELVNTRRRQLQEAQVLTTEFGQLLQHLSKFLDETDKVLQCFSKIPTDADRLNQQIVLQEELQVQTDEMRPQFDRLVELYSEIVKLVSLEDTNELEATVRNLTNKYNEVGTRCHNCGQLLANLAEGITSFLHNTTSLAEWLDRAEQEIEQFQQVSVQPEELIEQSEKLTELVIAVAEQGALVSQVVEDSRELCTHASGSEAIALQYRIDQLRNRYSQLAVEAENKIAVLTKAIPLSEEVKEGFAELDEFLNGVEEDLENLEQVPLEEQFQVVSTIEGDIGQFRDQLDDLQEMCMDLQRLSCDKKASELAKESAQITQRFNTTSDLVSRKVEQLKTAERQSRQTFDILDFWIDWFVETKESIVQADRPSVDMECLKAQLKHQHLLNEEIATEKSGLRDVIAEASKLARDLSSTLGNQDSGLVLKVEKAKKLAEETAELGLERTAELEQSLALCKELDDSYTELNEWMDNVEHELCNCEPITTGMDPKALMQQQIHNNNILQTIQAQRPMTTKFERNIVALSELCSTGDATNLQEINDQIHERFHQLSNAFKERGEALNETIEQSSHFSDRLDVFLSNLQGAVQQLRHSEPPSARTPVLQRQLAENSQLLELLRHKEFTFRDMKDSAQQVLGQAKASEPLVKEIAQNIEVLDDLWLELQTGAAIRQQTLIQCLQKAGEFWMIYEKSRNGVVGLRQVLLNSANDPLANQTNLQHIEVELGVMGGGMDAMKLAAEQLCALLNEDERGYVEQHLMILDSNWQGLLTVYSQISGNLAAAMDKSAQFNLLVQQLIEWLASAEVKTNELPSTIATSDPDQISHELAELEVIKKEVDENAVLREQLNSFAAELCFNAPVAQANTTRATVNEINQRYHQLYSLLNERQQRLERCLLETGQFSQAYAQLSDWIEKTKLTLDLLNTSSSNNLKQIEIELCKFRVIHNDIQAHLASYEAIDNAGQQMLQIQSESAPITRPMLETIAHKWMELHSQAENIGRTLEIAKVNASSRGNELDQWSMWLGDVLNELKNNKPLGGLPETAYSQLDDFSILKADVEQNRSQLEQELERLSQLEQQGDGGLQEQYKKISKNWQLVQVKLEDKEQRLKEALKEAINMHNGMEGIEDWLAEAESLLSAAPTISRTLDTLNDQIKQHSEFNAEVNAKKEKLKELQNKGVKMQLSCEKKDAIPMKNKLVSLKYRMDKVNTRTAERTRQLDNAHLETQLFSEARNELIQWINASAEELKLKAAESSNIASERVRDMLNEHKGFHEQIERKSSTFEMLCSKGKSLEDHAPPSEKKTKKKEVEILQQKWEELKKNTIKRQKSLEEALLQSGRFDELLAEMTAWLDSNLPRLEQEISSRNTMGDVETLHAMMAEHFKFVESEVDAHKPNVKAVRERAHQIIQSPNSTKEEIEDVNNKLVRLNINWQRIESAMCQKEECLTNALKKAVDMAEMQHELQDTITELESKVRRLTIPFEEEAVLTEIKELERIKKQLATKTPEFEKLLELARQVHSHCHPRAEIPMKEFIRSLTGKWDLLNQLVKEKAEKLDARLEEIQSHEKKVVELLDYVTEKKGELEIITGSDDHNQLSQLETLISEQNMFKSEIYSRQPDVDEAMKVMKRTAPAVPPPPTPMDTSMSNMSSSINSPRAFSTSSSHLFPLSPSKKSQSKGRLSQIDKLPAKSERQKKTDNLAELWKQLLKDTNEYEERLKQRKSYLVEMKRLENFTFDDWRERYLQWNDHGKARISDLFRRIDKSGTGMVPRKLFIDGILASKFPTTEMEMGRVADEFDKGDGMIMAKEFMNALRFDPKKRRYEPKSETERIHEEIAKEQARCTCSHRFPIQQINSGDESKVQYGFGFGSSMKRMVRILRSTVMVRVGGGWEALDHFLVKHDPCRAKGRINIDMFADDLRSTGSSTIEMFKRKTSTPSSTTSSLLGYSAGQGPIMKMREKTERSMPMFKKPVLKQPAASADLSSSSHLQTSCKAIQSFSSRRASENSLLDDSRIPRPSSSQSHSRQGSDNNMLLDSNPPSRSDSFGSLERPTRIPSLRGSKGARYQ